MPGVVAPDHHRTGWRFHRHRAVGPVLGVRRGHLAAPLVAARHEGNRAVVLGVVGEHEVHVAVVHLLRLRRQRGIQVVAVDARADFAGALHPGGAEAQHAVRAEQVLREAQARRVVGELLEDAVFPEHEALDVVDVRPPLRRQAVRPVAAQHGALQGFAHALAERRRPHFLRRHHGEAEHLQLHDVRFQAELAQFAQQGRRSADRFPVLYPHCSLALPLCARSSIDVRPAAPHAATRTMRVPTLPPASMSMKARGISSKPWNSSCSGLSLPASTHSRICARPSP